MNWTPTSFFAIRDANGEHLRTIDTFLEMGKATSASDLLARQDRAGGMPWVNTTAADRSGNALYADHSVVPNVSERPRPEVHDAGRPGALRGGRPARPRRHPCRQRLCLGHGLRCPAPRHLRTEEPSGHHPPRLGDERQRLLLAAQPRQEARGLRADHRLREVPAHPALADGLPLRDGRPEGRQGHPDRPARLPAPEPRDGRRGDGRQRRPGQGLRGRRRRRRLSGARGLGQALQREQSWHAHLRGVREAATDRTRGRHRDLLDAPVRGERPGQHAHGTSTS